MLNRWSGQFLSVLRIVAALGFMHHGAAKFFHFPAPPFAGPLPPLAVVGGLLELIGGGLLLIGLFARPVAFLLCGQMAVAYFMFHAPKGFFPAANGGEPSMLYCFIFLYIAAAGAGSWSIDAARSSRTSGA